MTTDADKARHPSTGSTRALTSLAAKVEKEKAATAAVDAAILEARASGASLRAIGDVMGHSHVAIHQRLRKLEEQS